MEDAEFVLFSHKPAIDKLKNTAFSFDSRVRRLIQKALQQERVLTTHFREAFLFFDGDKRGARKAKEIAVRCPKHIRPHHPYTTGYATGHALFR
jgi:hypothetical protein